MSALLADAAVVAKGAGQLPGEKTGEKTQMENNQNKKEATSTERSTQVPLTASEVDIDDESQAKEMRLAAREKRQPKCVYCGHPLDRVLQTEYDHLTWSWNPEKGWFFRDAVGDADKPYHDCRLCPNGCGARDWDFTDNELISY